jgi:hypothetical protein
MWSCLLLTDAPAESINFSGVSVVPAGDPLELIAAVDRAGADHLLVAAPVSLATELALALTLATANRPQLQLAPLVSAHAPLAVLSAMTLAQSVTEDPVRGVGLVHRLLENAWSGAWSNSVARLAEPAPSLAQHLRSLLPGAGFLIRQAPQPAVLGTPRSDDVTASPIERVLLVQEGAVPGPIAGRLAQATAVTTVRQVTMPGRWSSVYGTDRTGQLALMPAEPQLLLDRVTHRCPACRLEQVSSVCPFCRVLARPTASAGSTGGLS